jgi:hypothetical protein
MPGNQFVAVHRRRGLPLMMLAVTLAAACGAGGPGPSRQSATDRLAAGTAGVSQSVEPDPSSGAHGDIPDNAVFLTYHDTAHGFSVTYVEGWQVSTVADGVAIRDKDSSETVSVVPAITDVTAYVSGTDLPALRGQPGFSLVKQDKVTVKGSSLNHLAYHVLSAPDPVTGKQVASTVDRYYVPGPSALAIVSLSTPNGVDNVDAFRQMIQSFKWA